MLNNLQMKNAILFIILLIGCRANAQNNWRYGLLTSFELRGTSGDTSYGSIFPSENRFVHSYNIGVFIEKKISKKLSLSFEPAFQRIGSSKHFDYTNYNSDKVNSFTAIQIPIALKIKLWEKFNTEFGVAPVYILTGKETVTISSSSKIVVHEEKYEYLNQKYGTFRIQFPLFIGFGYNINQSIEIGVRGYIATEYYTYTGQDVFNPTGANPSLYDPYFRSTKQNQGIAFRLKYNFAK